MFQAERSPVRSGSPGAEGRRSAGELSGSGSSTRGRVLAFRSLVVVTLCDSGLLLGHTAGGSVSQAGSRAPRPVLLSVHLRHSHSWLSLAAPRQQHVTAHEWDLPCCGHPFSYQSFDAGGENPLS